MITKERLKELIGQGATIYDKYGYKIDLAERDNFLENIFNIYFKVEQDQLYRMNKDLQIAEDQWYLQNLFETEEDARWELEMTATRTETLKMPNWEERDTFFEFRDKDGNDIDLTICYGNILVQYYNRDNILTKEYFNKPLTKENYIEACKLCLGLFKGEEV